MDQHYDFHNARNTLEQLACEHKDIDDRRLANVTKATDWRRSVDITCVEGPQTWRLLKVDGLQEDEEVVFTLRGILCSTDLPPILEKPSVKPARFKYLRQSLSITGLGTPTFDAAIKSALEVYEAFDRQFSDGRLDRWGATKFKEHHALDLSNRYFTPKRDAPGMEHIPFTRTIDPQGILEDMARMGYIHGEENIVHYYARHVDEHGNDRYELTTPQSYRIGDIVEVQLSFIVVPLKGQGFKMLTVLRSVALLASQFTKAAQNSRLMKSNRARMVTRKVGYDNVGKMVDDMEDVIA